MKGHGFVRKGNEPLPTASPEAKVETSKTTEGQSPQEVDRAERDKQIKAAVEKNFYFHQGGGCVW